MQKYLIIVALLACVSGAGASTLPNADGSSPSAQVLIQSTLDDMRQSADLLKSQDAGPLTQDLQQRAVESLDRLIKLLRNSPPASPSAENPPLASSASAPGAEAAAHSQIPSGAASLFRENGSTISKDPKEWWILPPKDRQLILNALQDGALKAYQEKVRKYYEALAEIGRGK